MLITCPECELQVSDKAVACPHCGYPMVSTQKRKYNSKKHRRLPNGFGQITEIKGRNLRNPFRAMVTVGKTETGRPICKPLKPQAFFATYNDAYAALVEYNKNPYDLEPNITLKELYEKWSTMYFKTLKSKSSERTVTSAWAKCTSLYGMDASAIRARHIKACMDQVESENMKSRIKSLFNLMLDYAVEYEIVDRNYARSFNVSRNITTENEHIAFTDEELNTLWANLGLKYVDAILIQCYTGLRPQELVLIEQKNISLVENTIIGGMKTKAGTDRIIPIHPDIKPLIKSRLELGGKYLIDGDNFLTYDKYRTRFKNVCNGLKLNPEHRPHDPRKTFITLAKKYNVDEYAIKRIVGHALDDITEAIYTERPNSWLVEEVSKIKGPSKPAR